HGLNSVKPAVQNAETIVTANWLRLHRFLYYANHLRFINIHGENMTGSFAASRFWLPPRPCKIATALGAYEHWVSDLYSPAYRHHAALARTLPDPGCADVTELAGTGSLSGR